jgi:hypothetical protein
VFINQIAVGRFLQIGGFGLRNQDFFDLHTSSSISLNCLY